MKINSYIENLIKMGLKESEAKVYLNLLRKMNFTATEISRVSGVPRTKIYEVLNKLINKGLCVEILGSVKKYSPANPKTAFKGLLQKFQQNYQQELEYKKILMSNISETLLPLYHSEKGNTDTLDYIQVLREKNRIIEKVESLEKMAKKEVLMFTKPPYAMNTVNINAVRNREEFNRLKSGVKYKSIYEIDDTRTPSFLKAVEMFAAAGEEVRIAYKLPIKMMIFDERIVILSLRDKIISKPSLTSIVIEHYDLAKTLKRTFCTYWQEAMTLEEFKIKKKI